MTSPSELLNQAADLIRDTAAKFEAENRRLGEQRAAKYGWESAPQYTWNDVAGFITDEVSDSALGAGERWVALLNPAVAPAIGRWLRETAARASVAGLVNGGGTEAERYMESRYGAALEFARQVLGLENTPEEAK